VRKFLTNPEITWDQIVGYMNESGISAAGNSRLGSSYGISKAMLHLMTMLYARTTPNILSSAVSPGFIATNMTAGYAGGLKPEQGTVSIRHCLFNTLANNGWYYGSDALRSPLHTTRNPGEPAFTGSNY